MHIRMTETRMGSVDGHTVGRYHAGCIYEVADTLGKRFVRAGWAEWVDGDAAPRPEPSGSALLVASVAAQFNQVFRPQPDLGAAHHSAAVAASTGAAVQTAGEE